MLFRRPEAGRRRTPGRRRVLFFGTYDSRLYPRVRVLQEGFEALGDEVLECNVPLGLDTGMRVRILRRPWLAPIFAARLLLAWARLARRATTLPPVDLVVVGYMGHFDVHLARRLFPGVPVALDHLLSAADTAADRRIRRPVLLRALELLDRSALAAADIPCVDTREHLALAAAAADRAVVVPVGAAEDWFQAPQPRIARGPLRCIFFGSFTPLQGAPVIGDAIYRLAADDGIEFTLVGRGQDHARTVAACGGASSVRFVDWVEIEELPALVAEHDVCLGIFGGGPKALRVVPTKVFQGSAAGAAIVTSDTPPQREALGDAALYVPPGDSQALAAALRGLAHDRPRVEALRRAAHARASSRFRPAAVVAPLRERLAA